MSPMDDLDTVSPRAAARFLSKYCDNAADAGNRKRSMAVPVRIPCASVECQYSEHRLITIREKTTGIAAGRKIYLLSQCIC